MSHDNGLQPTSSPFWMWGKAQLQPLSLGYLVTVFIYWFLAARLAGNYLSMIAYIMCMDMINNIILPTFCWCAVGENHSRPLSCIFFLLSIGHFDVCNCIDLFKNSRTPLLSFPADCNTKKTVVGQSAWCLWKQFLLSVSMTSTWDSVRAVLVLQGQAGAILCNTSELFGTTTYMTASTFSCHFEVQTSSQKK